MASATSFSDASENDTADETNANSTAVRSNIGLPSYLKIPLVPAII